MSGGQTGGEPLATELGLRAIPEDERLIFETTPSQTLGPFFAIGLPFDSGPWAVPEGTPGLIRVFGTVYDGDGEPIPDHLIETWQGDGEGKFADLHGHGGRSSLPGFRGFARCGQEAGEGSFEIFTVKPGPVAGPGGTLQAPHIDVTLMGRGMLNRVVTRIYFADEEQANASDPVLASVPVQRRGTLLAQPVQDGYRFDIRVQGVDETVFFAV
jgi:protocatechuate 3,4-dioxygenase alpha subunit